MLSACNSLLADQAAEAPPVEESTPADEAEAVEEEISLADDIASNSGTDQADSAAAADDAASHLTEEGFVATAPTGRSLQPRLEQANIDINDVVRLLPPDAIRAVNPEELPEIMVTAAEANEAGLSPDTRVMGVSINGESHAYPIPFLSRHEIINTELGGRLIAATW
jgi:hypothetical protein